MNVGIVDASAINKQGTAATSPTTKVDMFPALVDIGAQKTMISTDVVNKVGLKPIGKSLVTGIEGNQEYYNSYIFHITFTMELPVDAASATQPGAQKQVVAYILQPPINGAELPLHEGGFDVLLGMDVICTGSLIVEGNGHYSFSF
jgi:hypothetical protein